MSSVGPANFGENYNHPQTVSDEEDEALETDDDVLDSFKMVRRNGKKHFCKCKRGPVGLPGAPGIEGKIIVDWLLGKHVIGTVDSIALHLKLN